jgi:hypothetical protein
MKKVLFSIALALAAVFAHLWEPVAWLAYRVYRVYERARDWLVRPTRASVVKRTNKLPQYIAPHALANRAERPRLSPTWRLCSST